MNTPIHTIAPPPEFKDPRDQERFAKNLWPLLNGNDAPFSNEPPLSLNHHRCIEFLAAYYNVNLSNSALIEARRRNENDEVIHSKLQEVAKSMELLESVEDKYTPIGFYGEPTEMNGVLYSDIKFAFPGLLTSPPPLEPESSHINISGLELLPPSELDGPIVIERWE